MNEVEEDASDPEREQTRAFILQLFTALCGFPAKQQGNLKWALFVLTDGPVVTLSWLIMVVKAPLQNASATLFPGTCAL